MTELNVSVDVIVIGAGIAGASVAAELSRTQRVAMVEMESQPGYHTTGRSAAVFLPGYGPVGVRALTRASLPFYDAPPDGFAQVPLLTPREVLMVAREDQRESLDALFDTISADTQVERLDAAAVYAHQPLLREGYAAEGMLELGGRDIDVAGLHQGYLRQFKAQGGNLYTKTAVEAMERRGDTWTVITRQGTLTAPTVINAAGAWADQLGQMAGAETIGLIPKRRTAMVVAAPDGFANDAAPMTIDVDEQFYLKPDAGRLLLSPADETPSDPGDVQPEELDVAICADRIMTAFNMDIRRIENKWAGLRSFVADKEPVVGFSNTVPGFFWMAGQGGYGIQTAPAVAVLASALVQGQAIPDHILATGFNPGDVAPRRLALAA